MGTLEQLSYNKVEVNPIFPVYIKARHCFYFSVSTAYITRLRGIVNACDPIVSTGLSESILKNKKETSRQKKMISCKGKTLVSKNNP